MLALVLLLAAATTPPPTCRHEGEGKILCMVNGKPIIVYTVPSWWPTRPSPYQPFPDEQCPTYRARSGDTSITCPEDAKSR